MIFHRLTKYGTQANSHDWFKAIAILLMVIDHIGVYFYPDEYIFRFIGRFSFPIFFFLIGYTYQGLRQDSPETSYSAWKKYYANLPLPGKRIVDFFWVFNIKADLLLCLILITGTNIIINSTPLPLNILFTVIVCRVALYLLEKYNALSRWLIITWLVLALVNHHATHLFEYGGLAVLLSICGYLIRQNKRNQAKPLTFILLSYITYCAFQMISFPATFNYIASLYIGIAVLFVFLWDYKFQEAYLLPKLTPLNYFIMFVSRYSLYVYTAHLLAFKIISHLFIPAS